MQARISNQRYNTKTSTVVCCEQVGLLKERGYQKDVLYMSKRGKYFLYRMTYANEAMVETIIPFSTNDAQGFMQECADNEQERIKQYYQVNKEIGHP